ncbi:hypothetical protein IV102_24495 [bacterium]|nr:hypothetical protein [bacterium]
MIARALQKLMADPLYQDSLDWGRPRVGHPEGSLRNHIEDLEANLELIRAQLRGEEYERLQLLIHVHDICKPDAWTGVLSDHPNNHAYMARQLLALFCPDPVLLAITQYHDDGYHLFTYYRWADDLSERIEAILNEVQDVELFMLFNLVDNCLRGKRPEPVDWLVERVNRQRPLSERVTRCLAILRAAQADPPGR